MSKFNKKNLILGLGVLSVATIGAIGISTNANAFFSPGDNQEARNAIESGDLDAFKTAISSEGNERLQSKLENLHEDQFSKIQERFNQREAIQTAIENNDYDAFVAATENSNKGKFKDVSEEEFAEIVEKRAKAEQFKSEITTAVESGNQVEFNNLLIEKQAEKESEASKRGGKNIELTEEKLQELWEKANEQLENGEEINIVKHGHGKRGGKGLFR